MLIIVIIIIILINSVSNRVPAPVGARALIVLINIAVSIGILNWAELGAQALMIINMGILTGSLQQSVFGP